MGRIDYLEPLVNYLKASPILNGHGIPNVPDLQGKNIFVFSDWNKEKLTSNWSYGLVIKPLESRLNIEIVDPFCKTSLDHRVMIGCQVRNPRRNQQHFQEDVQAGITSYTGAYPQASKLEELVRDTILAYNQSIQMEMILKPLTLVELPEPEESDGYLMMPAIYQTTYIY